MRVREIIIVEGRDDTRAVKRAVCCETIETHGFGMSETVWKEIEKAYNGPGIIIFTDPDRAGENIRRKILEKYPDAKQAFLPRDEAIKCGDIGVENATPEAVREALARVSQETAEPETVFTMGDIRSAGLAGGPGARDMRMRLCETLGIGYANASRLLKKLNGFGITRESFDDALRAVREGGGAQERPADEPEAGTILKI